MGKMELKYVPIDKIEVNWDFRTEPRDLEVADGIKKSIDSVGLVQPIKVRPKGSKYEVVAGRGRLEQYKKLKKKEIPAIIEEIDDEKAKFQSIIENVQRQNLTPFEMAKAFQEMLNLATRFKKQERERKGYKWLSEQTTISEDRISQLMSSVEATEPIKKKINEAIKNKKISEDIAVEILSRTRKDPKLRERILEQAIKKELGRPKVRELIKDEKLMYDVEESQKALISIGIATPEGKVKKTEDDYTLEVWDMVLRLGYFLDSRIVDKLSFKNKKRLLEELTDFKIDKLDPFMESLK